MPRPFKCRRVCFMPGVTYFKPAGIPLRFLEENCLSLEEIEAIRLHDLEHREQIDGARQMNISRPTFQRILASARRKIADSLLAGKALRIEGGHYKLSTPDIESGQENEVSNIKQIGNNIERNKIMKIALVTDDGKTICQHFGRARYYLVVTVEDGRVVSQEQRPKAGHHTAGMSHECHGSSGERHGFNAHAQTSHAGMISNITDCQVVIAGGMGWGAQTSLKEAGIAVHMTDIENIDEAVKLYLENKLPNLMERLH